MRLNQSNRFNSYEQARDVYYENVVPKYGATRMDWGFGRWLYLEYNAPDMYDELTYWGILDSIDILTADGRKRYRRELAKAKKEANNGHPRKDLD